MSEPVFSTLNLSPDADGNDIRRHALSSDCQPSWLWLRPSTPTAQARPKASMSFGNCRRCHGRGWCQSRSAPVRAVRIRLRSGPLGTGGISGRIPTHGAPWGVVRRRSRRVATPGKSRQVRKHSGAQWRPGMGSPRQGTIDAARRREFVPRLRHKLGIGSVDILLNSGNYC